MSNTRINPMNGFTKKKTDLKGPTLKATNNIDYILILFYVFFFCIYRSPVVQIIKNPPGPKRMTKIFWSTPAAHRKEPLAYAFRTCAELLCTLEVYSATNLVSR